MTRYRVSAPGSIFLIGEHAVVYGASSILCAVDQRVTLTAVALDQAVVAIKSDIAEPLQAPLDDLPTHGPYRFICETIRAYRSRMTSGVGIEVMSEIDPTMGLGSSAAVTAACVGALDQMTQTHAEQGGLHAQALSIIRKLQGRGSGGDLAASIFGGVLSYRLDSADPKTIGAKIGPLPALPQLSLRYVGYKTPTAEVLEHVSQVRTRAPEKVDTIYRDMGICADLAIAAAHARDWDAMAEHFTTYQQLMSDLGVSDDNLDKIIESAKGAMAAKISGSGLGDCVVAMGPVPEGFSPVDVARDGIIYHD